MLAVQTLDYGVEMPVCAGEKALALFEALPNTLIQTKLDTHRSACQSSLPV